MPVILFLSASPLNLRRIDLENEFREISEALRGSKYGGELRVEPALAVRSEDITSSLLRHVPTIVHFGGHGGQVAPPSTETATFDSTKTERDFVAAFSSGGSNRTEQGQLLIRDNAGNAVGVPPKAFADTFRLLRETRNAPVRCVVLNACLSAAQAKLIADHVDCVIGARTKIADAAAIVFASAFYASLGNGESVWTAFVFGKNAAALQGLDASMLRLRRRAGATAKKLRLTGPSSRHPLPFEDAWFANRLSVSIANAGARYTAELNVELPVSKLFDGLGRTLAFRERVLAMVRELRASYEGVLRPSVRAQAPTSTTWPSLDSAVQRSLDSLSGIMVPGAAVAIDSVAISAALQEASGHAVALYHELNGRPARSNPKRDEARRDAQYTLNQLTSAISDLLGYVRSNEFHLAVVPALLLVGEAGHGKTHLFCDVAERRVQQGYPTLLLLGEQFGDGEPWLQIAGLLGLGQPYTADQILGELDRIAEDRECRALIMIDALNEGSGRQIWPKYLAGLLAAVANYRHVGIALSVRTTYENLVVPKNLVPQRLIRDEHHGFAGKEYDAAIKYFTHYRILLPNVPLLNSEFQNPLFLMLMCEGLKNQGLSSIPLGFRGVTTIFDFYIQSLDERLWKELDLDPTIKVVRRSVDDLADAMTNSGHGWLPRDQARSIVDAQAPHLAAKGYQSSLFARLLSEKLLAEDSIWSPNQSTSIVRFTYERLSDHLIVKRLLDKHLDATDVAGSFANGAPLTDLILRQIPARTGWLIALSIQLPERVQQDLVDVVPESEWNFAVRRAFVQSLAWRSPDSITEATRRFVREQVFDLVVRNVAIDTATDPAHPYNADFLHEYLVTLRMPERDARWSTFLHSQADTQGAVDRLIAWAWSPEDKSHIDNKPVELAAKALAWFLTTSHRPLRDRATKALVMLLTPRLEVLRQTLQRFRDIDDVYIRERLYAVAYGCALRSNDSSAIGSLAEDVYNQVFANGSPTPHFLLRGYARGVIDVARARGIAINADLAMIRPPYRSTWPTAIPTQAELEAQYGTLPQQPSDGDLAQSMIYSSVMRFGDFARYIIGTNDGRFEWSPYRLGETTQADASVTVQQSPGNQRGSARFDLGVAQRWILQRIFELGWTPDLFGVFDAQSRRWGDFGRSAGKPERIGKKYQWIAYHEFLAHVSDNFKFKPDGGDRNGPSIYDGPWQKDGFDIDPSCILRDTRSESWHPQMQCFWAPQAYRRASESQGDVEWLKDINNIPQFTPLVAVADPSNLSRWLVLETVVHWQELAAGAQEDEPHPRHRDTYYIIKSYLVKKADIDDAYAWARKQRFMGRWMPESHATQHVLLGEFPWAPAFEHENRPYYSREGWTSTEDMPCEVLVATDQYLWESGGFDCSIDRSINILLPAAHLVREMQLRWNGDEGRFYSRTGTLIAYDPSIRMQGPSACLVNRELFMQYLEQHELEIFWTILGEKIIIGGKHDELSPGRTEINVALRLKEGKLVASPPIVEFFAPSRTKPTRIRRQKSGS